MSEQLHPDIEYVLLSEERIRNIVHDLGAQISKDYEGKSPLFVSVLRGGFVFTADLMRAVTIPCSVDFMAVSSYGDGVKSSGVVQIVKDIPGCTPAIEPAYVGAHVPNEFVVGYGLDYAERDRNLPFVGVLKPEVYS